MEGCNAGCKGFEILAIAFWIPNSCLVRLITILSRPSDVFVPIRGYLRVYTGGEEHYPEALPALPD